MLQAASSSDVVVGGFTLGLPQPDLHRGESPHCHMKQELPHVSQLIQVHAAQADQTKTQAGFHVPPARAERKQVTLGTIQTLKEEISDSQTNTR